MIASWYARMKRYGWATINGAPVSWTAATMASQSSKVEAIGFSTMIALPARAAAMAASAWRSFGRTMQTASTAGSAIRSR